MRTTITLNDKVFRALKMRAAETDASISQLVEDALKYQLLEDLEDIEDAKKRKKEPLYTYDALLAEFQAEGLV